MKSADLALSDVILKQMPRSRVIGIDVRSKSKFTAHKLKVTSTAVFEDARDLGLTSGRRHTCIHNARRRRLVPEAV